MAAFEDIQPQQKDYTSPLSSIKSYDFDNRKKMDLIIISANPQIQSLWDLMEMIVLTARNEAVAVDPSEEKKQVAALTIAHAMAKMYSQVRQQIDFITNEHLAESKRLDMEKKLESPDEIEKILLGETVLGDLNNY